MDIKAIIDNIWSVITIPVQVLDIPGSFSDDAMECEFLGKRYSDVNVGAGTLGNKTPLVYFNRDAKFYYLGSYLLYAFGIAVIVIKGERLIFYDVREVHAIETLRKFVNNEYHHPVAVKNNNLLIEMLDWFDMIE